MKKTHQTNLSVCYMPKKHQQMGNTAVPKQSDLGPLVYSIISNILVPTFCEVLQDRQS